MSNEEVFIKSDRQAGILKNKLNKVIIAFEKEHNYTLHSMFKGGFLPAKVEEIVDINAIRVLNIERNVRDMQQNNTCSLAPTADSIFSDAMNGIKSLPIEKQNEVLANIFRAIKKERNERVANTSQDLVLAQKIASKAQANFKSIEAIMRGGLDELNF